MTVVFERLRHHLRHLLRAALEFPARSIAKKIEGLVGKLDDITAKGGAVPHAVFRGIRGALMGKSVLWEVIKGAVSGLRWQGKLVLVLLVILSPVLMILLVVVLLLVLLVGAVVAALRAVSRSG